MTQSSSFPDKKTIAELTLAMLLEVEAVRLYTDKPFVVFYSDIFPEGLRVLTDLGVEHHARAMWWDVLAVAKKSEKCDGKKLNELEAFIRDPRGWSKAHGGTAGAGG